MVFIIQEENEVFWLLEHLVRYVEQRIAGPDVIVATDVPFRRLGMRFIGPIFLIF